MQQLGNFYMFRELDNPKKLLSILIMTLLLGMKMSTLLKLHIEVGVKLCGVLDLFLSTSAKEKKEGDK